MRVLCPECQTETVFSADTWHCTCGGAWEIADLPPFDDQRINGKDYSIWRYGELLGLDVKSSSIRMGVGWTPLVPADLFERQVHLKLDYLLPSGSFKDRGVNAMINQLYYSGARSIIEDSSGNAGASVAAHAARFGIEAEIYVPANTLPIKLRQIEAYGASVVKIQGSRQTVEIAAQAGIRAGKTYASHAYHPAYLAGQMTGAFEIWEQLDRNVPDWVICPVGQGGALLGLWFGFRQLLSSGHIPKLPHLVAVQAARIAPVVKAWEAGKELIPQIEKPEPSMADGVAIAHPVRGKRILQALSESKGKALAISEELILNSQETIARKGFLIEATSALAVAGLSALQDEISPEDTVVVFLTGSGLKSLPQTL